jgi:hypothetical protein
MFGSSYKILYDLESDINEDQLQRRYGCGQFARSLPVPVPQFMQEKNHSDSNSGVRFILNLSLIYSLSVNKFFQSNFKKELQLHSILKIRNE